MAKQTKPTLRALLKDLERGELLEIVLEVCKLNKKNKQFVEAFIQGSDALDYEALLQEAKQKIYATFYTPAGAPRTKFNLRGAKGAIADYSKILKGPSSHIADLKLYYVELGASIVREYGDIYESFYNSLLSVFESFCLDLEKQPELIEHFLPRLAALTKTTKWMGYGYAEDIDSRADVLRKKAFASHSQH